MENKKRVAIRTCIATGEKKDKKEMIRLVRLADGSIAVDLKGKIKGRGASLSASIDALETALKKKAIERALKLERKLTNDEVIKLKEEFASALNERELRYGKKRVEVKISKEEFGKITNQ